MMSKPIYEALLNVDRKYLYLLMLLAVLIPFLLEIKFTTYETGEVQRIYDKVEAIYQYNLQHPEEPHAMWFSFDYDPATTAELDPMTFAVLRHAFLRKVPVIMWASSQTGLNLASDNLNLIAKEYGAVYSKDYVFLGWSYPMIQSLLGCNSDIKGYFLKDFYGNDTVNFEILRKIPNLTKVDVWVTIAGNVYPQLWVAYAYGMYKMNIATGCTAVSAAEFYPYVQTNQMIGMMGGLKGAAEYEQMVERLEKTIIPGDLTEYMQNLYKDKDLTVYNEKYFKTNFTKDELKASIKRRYQARRAMSPQAWAHMLVIGLIIVGNICFFMKRKAEKNS